MPSHRNSSPPALGRRIPGRRSPGGAGGWSLLCGLLVSGILGGLQPVAAQSDAATRAAERERQLRAEFAKPGPIEAVNSVWIEELTGMEVRDAMGRR